MVARYYRNKQQEVPQLEESNLSHAAFIDVLIRIYNLLSDASRRGVRPQRPVSLPAPKTDLKQELAKTTDQELKAVVDAAQKSHVVDEEELLVLEGEPFGKLMRFTAEYEVSLWNFTSRHTTNWLQ